MQELADGWASAQTDDLTVRPSPTAEELRERMSGNICRCGAYSNIIAALEEVIAADAGQQGAGA